MKELLIANGQEVPSGESNVSEPHLILLPLYLELALKRSTQMATVLAH